MPRRHVKFHALRALLPALFLAACGNSPYPVDVPKEIDRSAAEDPRNQGKTARLYDWQPVTKVQAISFCYSDLFDSKEEVREEAELRCKGGRVELQEVDYHFRGCALFQPYRATFLCLPGPAEDNTPTTKDSPAVTD
jgi:hypothetical protein